jgi:hypothetical protein
MACRRHAWFGSARKYKVLVPHTLVIVDPNGVICVVARSTATNKFANSLFFRDKFNNNAFLGYVRDYNARLQYMVRSADDNAVSKEAIPVQAQPPPTP